MIGLGTIINTVLVILGGALGLLFKKGLKESMQDSLMKACGVAVIVIGLSGSFEKMQSGMLLIFSLIIGVFLGEMVNIESKVETLGERIKEKVKAQGDNKFIDGFVNNTLVICVGAMAIVGPIEDGISGDPSMLIAKAVLDMVITCVFASIYGVGALFSALVIFVYQGAITIIAHFAGSFVSDQIVNSISFVGNVIVACVGVNLTFGKTIKVGNMLPALLIPIVYEIVINFI